MDGAGHNNAQEGADGEIAMMRWLEERGVELLHVNRVLRAHEDHKFIAGIPDGAGRLNGDTFLIECKHTQAWPDFLTRDGELKTTSHPYYQIIGLLEIFNIEQCWLMCQVANQEPFLAAIVQRNRAVFNGRMLNRLWDFYINHMLPMAFRAL